MPRASIVVPSRGGRHRLPVLLASAEAQTESDFEVIVVVDGDVDDSEGVVAQWSSRVPVRAIVFGENRGRAAALNAGFGAATGDVFIRADDDLELEPDFVEHHVRLHQEQECGVIAMCRDVFPDTPYARAYGIRADENIRTAAFATPPDRTWQWWSGNVSTTADDYRAVGGYDESFRAYGWEDVEWGYRLHRLGRPIVIAPGFSTLHHGPVTSTTERVQRAFHSGSASQKFISKHGAAALEETPGGGPASVWDRLVALGAFAATDRTVTVAGHLLDRSVDRLPRYVAEKLVALAVQSSARAGRKYPQRIRNRV